MPVDRLTAISKAVVRPGQPLLYPILDRSGALLAQKGTVLTDSQASALVRAGTIYTYHSALVTAVHGVKTGAKFSVRASKPPPRPLDESVYRLPSPFDQLTDIEQELTDLYTDPDGASVLADLATLINRVQFICREAADPAVAKVFLDDKSQYTVQHAIHTACLCELAALTLRWDAEERRSLVGAALTMNMALGLFQDELRNQSAPLSRDQQQRIQQHPAQSVEMLHRIGINDPNWLEYVEKHHESVDGKGYPAGLLLDDIPLGASLLSAADVYCAKVAGRSYRAPLLPNIAAREFFLSKGRNQIGSAIDVIIKTVGLFPPGCVVHLANREIALVLRRGSRVDTPQARVLVDADGYTLRTTVVRSTANKSFAIVDVVPPEKYLDGMDYAAMWGFVRH